MYLGEHLGEIFKDVGAVEATVKVDVQLSRKVWSATQLEENITVLI